MSAITSVLWNFGDNATSTEPNPRHTYTASGTYTISLAVTNANGSDSKTKVDYIAVGNAPPGLPTAAFSANPTSGTTPLSVTFTDQSVSGGNPIQTWAWDFGDGGTATIQNPSHAYMTAGTYTVSLTVTNARGSDPKNQDRSHHRRVPERGSADGAILGDADER